MPLIHQNALSQVVAELCRRNVKLCHACQLKDLKSYLQISGVPSRNLLASKNLPYTAFDTDKGDQQKGTWKLVFFNLSDFGYWFSRGKSNIPNPYGPILLCFDPKVLKHANDISITLWSAGACDFDRELNGIAAEDVPRLFTSPENSHIRFAGELRAEFAEPRAQSPEINSSFDNELAVMDYLAYIRVDPYSFDTGYLPDVVREMVAQYDLSCRVYERACPDGHTSRYQILWDAITQSASSGGDVLATIGRDSPLSTWADHIRSKPRLSYQFGRYARYLADGTASECLS